MTAISRAVVHSLVALAIALPMGCQNPTQAAASQLQGHWSRLDELNPYRFTEEWNLSANGSALSGSGTWSGEACCDGTVSIAGRVDADSVHVIVNLVATRGVRLPAIHYRFDGIVALDHMLGVATADDSTKTTEYFQKKK